MTETEIRNQVVTVAKKYLGCNESDGSHKKIIDIYNAHRPLARGYAVKYTDAWCATFVSAVSVLCGLTDIMPTECSCSKMIQLYKNLGRWQEADDYVPKLGDIIMYDWGDTGSGDNTGAPDHVGIVAYISSNTMKIIEGNISDAVNYRTLSVNGKYIRGYCLPDFASKTNVEVKEEVKVEKEEVKTEVKTEVKENKTEVKTDVKEIRCKDSAKNFLTTLAGTYKVTGAKMNVRHGAGTGKQIMVTIPKGTIVKSYGYYTQWLGRNWLVIQFTYNGVKYTGFASDKNLKK